MKCSLSGPDLGSGRVAGLRRRAVGTPEQRRWHPVMPASPCVPDILSEGGCKSSGGEDPPIHPPVPLQGCFAYVSLGKAREFYCGCTEERSQEVALWLADPGVERRASQMQHIVNLAAPCSAAAWRSGRERRSAKS